VAIPCIHCLREQSYDPYVFSRTQLEDAVASGSPVVFCRAIYPIQVDSMAPELTLEGMSAPTIKFEDLELKEMIGEGGNAKVSHTHTHNAFPT
jgi:hypothetical protein